MISFSNYVVDMFDLVHYVFMGGALNEPLWFFLHNNNTNYNTSWDTADIIVGRGDTSVDIFVHMCGNLRNLSIKKKWCLHKKMLKVTVHLICYFYVVTYSNGWEILTLKDLLPAYSHTYKKHTLPQQKKSNHW